MGTAMDVEVLGRRSPLSGLDSPDPCSSTHPLEVDDDSPDLPGDAVLVLSMRTPPPATWNL